jgi:hypothetical protein
MAERKRTKQDDSDECETAMRELSQIRGIILLCRDAAQSLSDQQHQLPQAWMIGDALDAAKEIVDTVDVRVETLLERFK